MRRFRRPAVLVPSLAPEGAAGRLRLRHAEQYEGSEERPATFPGYWTRPDVRGALYAMQGRVCAYCGADIKEAGIDVDHFRPKSGVRDDPEHGGYWWLAYVFDNYVLSCTICNQRCKGTRFPLRAGAARCIYERREWMAAEDRVLLDPTLDDVEAWLAVDWSTPVCRLVPAPGADAERVEQVLAFFRLNLKPAQVRARQQIQRTVLEQVASGTPERVRDLAIRYRAHSLVARHLLALHAPHVLPKPEEELAWLVEDLCSDLVLKLEYLNRLPGYSEVDENEAREFLWALAVLWADPPAASAGFVEAMLEARGVRESVAAYRERLAAPR